MARSPSPRGEASRRGRSRESAPWLEEAEREPDTAGGATLIGRSTLWLILLGLLALVSLVAAGVFMVARQEQGDIDALPPGAEIPVLRDPGPWKVPPEGPGVDGIPVEGRDQVLYGAGVGDDPQARIALDALPEEPVERDAAPAAVLPAGPPPTDLLPEAMRDPAAARQTTVAAGPEATRPAPPAAAAAPTRPASDAAGSLVQLGAFSSEARARAAWKSLSARFSYLSGRSPIIVPIAGSGEGRTLYRLRVDAGTPDDARDICGRLKVAGETCALVGG